MRCIPIGDWGNSNGAGNMSELEEMLGKVEASAGPDTNIDTELHAYIEGVTPEWQEYSKSFAYHKDGFWVSFGPVPNYTASVDAALALVERMLPNERWGIDRTDEGDPETWYDAVVGEGFAQHRSAPVAILAALLRALIAKG